jgi:hypothetical protein
MGNEAFRRGFTQEEVLIRNCYDAFLDGLQRFSSYVQAGLIDASSLRPYIGYWLDCISSPAENAEDAGWRAALLSYVSFYQYCDVVWLLNAFGKDIRPSSRAYVCFLKQMSDQELASKLAETVGCKYPSNKEK